MGGAALFAKQLETFRRLCVGCLVLDCIFALIYSLTFIDDSSRPPPSTAHCSSPGEQHWREISILGLAISAAFAIVTASAHSTIACKVSWTKGQMQRVTQAGWGL